jgi:peptide/nickel transport system permease protein
MTLAYIAKRLAAMFGLLIVISIVVFGLFYIMPSDPAALTCGKNCTAQILKQDEHALGYDKPVATQYFDFVKGFFSERNFPDDPAQEKRAPQTIVHCEAPCLGYSPVQGQLVSKLISQAFPITLSLAVGSFVIWIFGGVGIGVIAAVWRGSWVDRLLSSLALVTYSMPAFFVGFLMLDYLCIRYGILPQPQWVSLTSDPIGWAKGMVAAWLTLAALYAATYVRFTRANMIETSSEDFIRTALAKGVPQWRITIVHTLRAAVVPLVTLAGMDLAGVLGGAAIIENVFNLNGIGKLAILAVTNLDLPVIVACVLIGAFMVVFFNFLVDILYSFLDPRVKQA